MSSSSRTTRCEGLEPPPTRPTLAMTHLELESLGEEIIRRIIEIIDQGRQGNFLVNALLELLDKIAGFIRTVLLVRSLNDGVAF